MAVNSGVVTVSTTATALAAVVGNTVAGRSVLIKNPSGSVTVYIGGSDVTADATAGTGGYPLGPGGELAVALDSNEMVYGRVAASTQTVHVLRQGA